MVTGEGTGGIVQSVNAGNGPIGTFSAQPTVRDDLDE
jgi:hypothetical protein